MGQSLEEGWQNSLLSGISDQSSIGMFISLNGKKLVRSNLWLQSLTLVSSPKKYGRS